MARNPLALGPEDHERITAAIFAAERQSDGEIVPIVAPRSDRYHDVALHWAVLAMLAVPAVIALLPQSWVDRAASLIIGWNGEFGRGTAMMAVLALTALMFLIVRLVLSREGLRMAVTPGGTKARRVRRRAIELFRASCEDRTRGRTGVVIYVSLAEHRAEIVADAAIHSRVSADVWGAAMAGLIDSIRDGKLGDGLVRAIDAVGAVLAEHLPNDMSKDNEMPDRVIEL